MTTSDQINELASALAKAQAAMSGAKKDSTNPHFKSTYADLASIWDACREPITTQGLSVVQSPRLVSAGDGAWIVELETRLLHTSGQWLSDTIAVPLGQPTPQGVGSAVTYCRRYALAAVLGIAPEDDDAEGAMGRTMPKATAAHPTTRDDGFITEPQRARFFAVSKAKGWSTDQVRQLLDNCKIAESSKIKRAQYDDLISTLEAGPVAYEVGF